VDSTPTGRSRRRRWWLAVPLAGALIAVACSGGSGTNDQAGGSGAAAGADAGGSGGTTAPAEPQTAMDLPPYDGWVNPESSGMQWSNQVDGLITFRGNPTRSWYGKGPVPTNPQILWSFPANGGLCSNSTDDSGTHAWCGTGWNGSPSVWERDGQTWVAFGAYDRGIHFLNAQTGQRMVSDLVTGDLAKGTVTVDPDGFPLLYHGSRDNYFRAIAFDRPDATELWKLWAYDVTPTLWNDDWDGSALVIDDYLFEGGENGQIHIVKLNRGYGPDGKVTVNPQLVFHAPAWDAELLKAIGDTNVSIENSVAISGNTLYFANSGGLVQGWDISGLKDGKTPERIFRFWTGDDTDPSIVIDKEGYLYVASEWKRHTKRGAEIGQVMKLDPRKPDDPLVWSVKDQTASKAGVWGTPAIYKDMLYVDTNTGRFMGIDRATGQVRWEKKLPGPTWQSPVVVDDKLIEGDCNGVLHAYDVSDTTIDPPEIWNVKLDGCIESTPAVWKGRIFVGARGGKFYAIGDPDLAPAQAPNETVPARPAASTHPTK